MEEKIAIKLIKEKVLPNIVFKNKHMVFQPKKLEKLVKKIMRKGEM